MSKSKKEDEVIHDQIQDQQIDSELKIGDRLAVGRTKMALERTLMAAIRTSVSMISFGFTIAKFFQDFKSFSGNKSGVSISTHNVGFWLVVIGTLFMMASCVQHGLVMKNLKLEGEKRRVSFSLILALVISVLGLALSISFYSDFLSLGLNE